MTTTMKDYITMVRRESEHDELYDIAVLSDSDHGIDNVMIWIGTAANVNPDMSLRIKISNLKNKFEWDDHFDIKFPELLFDHDSVSEWITTEIMSKIIQWLKLNNQLLVDYQNGTVFVTDDFLSQIKT